MSTGKGYSLWLIPDPHDKAYDLIEQFICRISSQHNTPLFPQHVTLLSDLRFDGKDMYEKFFNLVAQLDRYEMQLDKVGSKGLYFQNLFLTVRQTDPVLKAHALAEKVFALETNVYFPHLSLAYGDFSKQQVEELQQKVSDELPKRIKCSFVAIELWRTIGTVAEWYKMEHYPL